MKELDLSGQDIGDFGVEEALRNNPDIEILDISETLVPRLDFLYDISFDGISLDNLKEINISLTNIKDLSPLAELKNLKILYANHLQLSDLSSISELTNLEKLSIEYSQIEDLSPLRNLKKLKSLSLFGNSGIKNINDLCELNALKELSLQGTGINRVE